MRRPLWEEQQLSRRVRRPRRHPPGESEGADIGAVLDAFDRLLEDEPSVVQHAGREWS